MQSLSEGRADDMKEGGQLSLRAGLEVEGGNNFEVLAYGQEVLL